MAPALHLTFDDGPDPQGTPAILAALARNHAQATFFVTTSAAQDHLDLVERIAAEGHEVGLHCHEHRRHTELSCDEVGRDTDRALAVLARAGVRPRRWRTPWGTLAPFTARLARERRLELVGWTLDSHDWRGDPAGEMLAAIGPGVRDGAIVLAHDGLGPGVRRSTVGGTVDLTDGLCDLALERGLTVAALGEHELIGLAGDPLAVGSR